MDDWQLLRDYVERGSEPAFRALVDRHLPLVHGAARRQIQSPELAEDVSQTVFILLAKKARTFRRGVVLPGWLFRTTRFVATRALRAEQRRQRREQETFQMQQLHSPAAAVPHLAPVLDEALAELGAKDRDALLLRFAQDRNLREVGQQLGVSEAAAKKRVSRALDRLRGFFARRGFTLSTTVLVGVLTEQLAHAAPAELASRIAAHSLSGGATAGAGVSALVAETVRAWRWANLKLAASIGVTGVASLGLVMALAPSKPAQSTVASPGTTESAAAHAKTSAAEALTAVARNAGPVPGVTVAAGQVLCLHIFAKDTGEPVVHASLALNVVTDREWRQRFDLATDDTGSADVPYPVGTGRLDVGVLSRGWVARFMTWITDRDDPLPADYTLHVDRVAESMGGWVRDEEGQAVAGAEIWGSLGQTGDSANRETPRERFGFLGDAPLTRTDAQGHWTCAVIPAKDHRGFQLKVRHPDFPETSIASCRPASEIEATVDETLELLWAGRLVTTMNRGLTLAGRVLDEGGTPIAGAEVAHAPHATDPLKATTSFEGRFAIPKLEAGSFDFVVTAPGFAPEYRKVELAAGTGPVEIRMKPGAVLRLRVVDEAGRAVPGATVGIEAWGGLRHKIKWTAESGPDGRIEWTSAPPDGGVELYAFKPDWCYTRDIRLQADGEEHVITMRRALVVTGTVTDAETGLSILDAKAFPGYGTDEYCWERLDTRRANGGAFKVVLAELKDPWRVRVEADGYASFVSQPLTPASEGVLDVALRPLDSSKALHGVVLRPDGQPATNAEVLLQTLDTIVEINRLHFRRLLGEAQIVKTKSPDGGFSFAPDPKAHTVVAASLEGFARVRIQDPCQPLTLHLQSWGRVEGVIDASARGRPVENVVLEDAAAGRYRWLLHLGHRPTKPDARGRFVYDLVPPGAVCVWLFSGSDVLIHHGTPVNVSPGEVASVVIAETGCRVTGRLVATSQPISDWAELLSFAQVGSRDPPPEPPAGLTGDAAKLWLLDLWGSDSGRRLALTAHSTDVKIAADGSFEGEETLPPGAYRLTVAFKSKFPVLRTLFTVPPPGGSGPAVVDLGNLVVDQAATSAAR